MLTAFLGLAMFGEKLPPLWWVGAAGLVVGNVVIGRREEEGGKGKVGGTGEEGGYRDRQGEREGEGEGSVEEVEMDGKVVGGVDVVGSEEDEDEDEEEEVEVDGSKSRVGGL